MSRTGSTKGSRRAGSGQATPTIRIAVPDLISNSYFPAIAAVELGCFASVGLNARIELLFPVDAAYRGLARGEVHVVAGSAHSALAAFPDWRGVRLLCSQSHGMYWFLVMRRDRCTARNDASALRGSKIGAAPWVDLGLQQLVLDSGISLDEVEIVPIPGAAGAGTNFGLTAASALAERKVDGFWANGLGAATAVASGAGTIVLDVRRGDGPSGCFDYTFASLAATEEFICADLPRAQAIVDALRNAQSLLSEDPGRATEIGDRLFPPAQAALIGELIRQDLPFYEATIPEHAIAGLNRFTRERGLLSNDVPYEQIVAMDIERS